MDGRLQLYPRCLQHAFIRKAGKRFKETGPRIDRRTNGYKARVSATMHKPDAAIAMIREALAAGVPAQYILMDTWFTNEPFIKGSLIVGSMSSAC